MAVAFGNIAAFTSANNTTVITINYANRNAGDLLILVHEEFTPGGGSSLAYTWPSGFTAGDYFKYTDSPAGGNFNFSWAYKWITAAATGGTSTITTAISGGSSGSTTGYQHATSFTISGLTGTEVPTWKDASAVQPSPPSTSSVTVSSFTPTYPNSVLVGWHFGNNNNSATAPSGWTIAGTDVDASAETVSTVSYSPPTSGATGNLVFGTSAPQSSQGVSVMQIGLVVDTGSGIINVPPVTMSGTGSASNKGTGALALSGVKVAGTGTTDNTGSGALHLSGVTLSGSGTGIDNGSGNLQIGAVTLSGYGFASNAGQGALGLSDPTLSMTGTMTNSGSGTLSLAPVTLGGSGYIPTTVTGTGNLALPDLQVAGHDTNEGSGALTLASVAVLGADTPSVVGSGAMSTQVLTFSEVNTPTWGRYPIGSSTWGRDSDAFETEWDTASNPSHSEWIRM